MKVFVHGNPETAFVWSMLVHELERRGVDDIVLLSPPGFGAAVPPGFAATHGEYRDWLVGEIEAIGEPVDLVGHDWGAGHVYAVAAARPDLLRSWAGDCGGLMHPDYQWHRAATVWQTPERGEAAVAELIALNPDELGTRLRVPPALAEEMAANLDERMGEVILRLYRSAMQPALRDLGDRLAGAARRPGLLIDPTADRYVPSALLPAVAARTRARTLRLEGLGHWWMWEDPALAADGLVSFWDGL
jgi:pimeloyl-ACP methyl ester carboxylesterase